MYCTPPDRKNQGDQAGAEAIISGSGGYERPGSAILFIGYITKRPRRLRQGHFAQNFTLYQKCSCIYLRFLRFLLFETTTFFGASSALFLWIYSQIAPTITISRA